MRNYEYGGIFNQDPTEFIDKYVKPKPKVEKEYDYIENGKKKKHTPRQWKLYEFYKAHDLKGKTQQEIIKCYEEWICEFFNYDLFGYGYLGEYDNNFYEEIDILVIPFSDMTSARQYRKDKQALQKSETITAIITKYGIARTRNEARQYLDKSLIGILKQLKRYHIQNKHYGNDGQIRLVFNTEKDIIEAIKKLEGEVE